MSANVLDGHLCSIITWILKTVANVPDNTKVATVRPIYKKKSRNGLENYRSFFKNS